MENFAIIGSSPIMLITSIFIANQNKNNQVFIFNKDEWLGGAWRKVDTPYGRISSHNNIIVPLNHQENSQLENIKLMLEKINLPCKIVSTNAKINTNWQPKRKLVYEIDDLIKKIEYKNNIIVKGPCDSIKLENKVFLVNDNKFKKCFIPSRFSNINFLINNRKLDYKTDFNISHHYTFIFDYSNKLIDEQEYSEDFDDYFDRGQINKISSKYFFLIGRLRRKHKHLSENEIVNIYKEKFKIFLLKYFKKNVYLDAKIINNGLIFKKYPQIVHIDTDQFVRSFLKINRSIFKNF